MTKMMAGILGLFLMAATPSFAACLNDKAGLTVDVISKSDVMEVLNQIGGFTGLTGTWENDSGAFTFDASTGKIFVTFAIGTKQTKTTVIEVCKLSSTSLKVTASAKDAAGKEKVFPAVFMKLTGNKTKIQLGFAEDDMNDFVKVK